MLTTNPSFGYYKPCAEMQGMEIEAIPYEATDFSFPLNQIKSALAGKNPRLFFLCNPNNPTGQILRAAELEQIVRLAEQVGAYVLCDEVYAGLEGQGERVPAIAGLYERGISTGSVSKALGLQGLRTGWLICRDRQLLFDALVLRENSSEIMNVLGEAVAEIALRPARHAAALAKARQAGAANLQLLNDFITNRPELTWQPPPAGLIGLCRLLLPVDSEQLAQQLLAPPYRTFVIPGAAYGYPQHIRLGVGGGNAVALEAGLQRLATLLDTIVASR